MKRLQLAGAVALLAMLAPAAHAADDCTAYDAQSLAMEPDLKAAFQLMQARDIPGATRILPKLEAYLAALPATMPAPKRCGTQVSVFDHHQYLRFAARQKAGKPVPGYAAGTVFVEKLLNFTTLAYAVGWLRYENQNFAGALTAFAKGLQIAPGDHDLANEYVATQLNLKDFAATISYVDSFLSTDSDMETKTRATMLAAKALAQFAQGNVAAAKTTIAAALKLDPENSNVKSIADQMP